MYKQGNSDLKCTDYSIPINISVLGYLQHYIEDTVLVNNDVVAIKNYVVDLETGAVTEVEALNKISQHLGGSKFRTVIQGYTNLPTLTKFKFKTVITYGNPNGNCTICNTREYYTPVYSWEDCSDISAIIPCIIDGQEYTINGNFIGVISTGIVYQSWKTAAPKKYSPAIFLRNVHFNRNNNTVEFKKLNNKPLKTTLKRNYNLYCEPIGRDYLDEFDEVFSFGKVNILSKTFVLESFSVEVIDEKDCCSLYRLIATAYEESKLRLLCSNNCTVLQPIDCDDFVGSDFTNIINEEVENRCDDYDNYTNIINETVDNNTTPT